MDGKQYKRDAQKAHPYATWHTDRQNRPAPFFPLGHYRQFWNHVDYYVSCQSLWSIVCVAGWGKAVAAAYARPIG